MWSFSDTPLIENQRYFPQPHRNADESIWCGYGDIMAASVCEHADPVAVASYRIRTLQCWQEESEALSAPHTITASDSLVAQRRIHGIGSRNA
jgi:hypothetical protein